jgi:uncharacterized protein YrrD
MPRVSTMIGKSVVSADTGEKLGSVSDTIVGGGGDRIVGLVVRSGFLASERVLPFQDVQALGHDAIVAVAQDRMRQASEWRAERADTLRSSSFTDKRIVTADGRELGTVQDLHIDERTGDIDGYDVSERLFGPLVTRRRLLRRSGDVTLGRDVIVCPRQRRTVSMTRLPRS